MIQYVVRMHSTRTTRKRARTNSTGKNSLVVNVALHPGHQLLDVGRGSHLGWTLVVFAILPQVLKPTPLISIENVKIASPPTYSSVAFISGQD